MTRKRLKRLLMACGYQRNQVEMMMDACRRTMPTHEHSLRALVIYGAHAQWALCCSDHMILRYRGMILAVTGESPRMLRVASVLPAEVAGYLPWVMQLNPDVCHDDKHAQAAAALSACAAEYLLRDTPSLGGDGDA